MNCIFNRPYDAKHPVCISCGEQDIACNKKQERKTRVVGTSGPVMIDGKKAWVVTGHDLPSLNDFANKRNGLNVYKGIKRTWRRIFSGAVHHFGKAKGRRGLTVRRYISGRQQRMDRDNLIGGLKPQIDCLKEIGVFVDDTEKWLTLVEVEQIVGSPRVEFIVEDLS